MGAALVLLLVGLGALAAGVLIGRYYVPDDRQLRRTARHSRAYMRALGHLIARDHDTAVSELRNVVEENVEDVEPYFALGALFRSRGEHERAIRVHQALAVREHDRRKLRQRAMYELGLDFRAAGMPRRATRAMEEVVLDEPDHEGALRVLAALYEEQARFNEAAGLWQRLGKRRGDDTGSRVHHLLVAAGQAALGRGDLDSAKQLLKEAQNHQESAHFLAAAAELAAARGNHRGAKERLKQALVAEPALAPHLLPGLIAAEQGLAGAAAGADRPDPRDDLDDVPAEFASEARQLASETTSDAQALLPLGAGGGAGTGSQVGLPVVAAPGGPGQPQPSRVTAITATLRVAGDARPAVVAGVLAALAEVEAKTGPRLELALIRAALIAPGDEAARTQLASQLTGRFPDSLAARVATARLALITDDAAALRGALAGLVSDTGALAWALQGRWQCAHCGNRPASFTWRCGQCRRWNTLRMETGVEPPPAMPRERREKPRTVRADGAAADGALPAPTLDPGLTDIELQAAGSRRSLLGRVGGWVSGVLGRDAS